MGMGVLIVTSSWAFVWDEEYAHDWLQVGLFVSPQRDFARLNGRCLWQERPTIMHV